MKIIELEALSAMIEAVSKSRIVMRTVTPQIPKGGPDENEQRLVARYVKHIQENGPEVEATLDGASTSDLKVMAALLRKAVAHADDLAGRRAQLDAWASAGAREAFLKFSDNTWRLNELESDLAGKKPNYATWPGHAEELLPIVRCLLDATRFVQPAESEHNPPTHSSRAEVEAAILGEIRNAPGRFAGMSDRAGSRWLKEKGIRFSGASLSKLPIWQQAKRVGIGSPRRETSHD
jgi:hypothetical protein